MILLLCIVLLGNAVAQNSNFYLNNHTTKEDSSYRLTGEAIPLSYEITIEPNFDTFTFRGFVHIKVSITKLTNSVLMHENTITVSSINVERDGMLLVVNAIQHDGERDFLQISVEEDLMVDDIVDIFIAYQGELNENNQGFYRVKSVDSDGTESWLALTQMAPTFARQVFPCFDEPALKANFSLNIIRPAHYNSASNMPLLTTTQMGADRYMDVYEATLKMSTYLVAFVVSEFASISNDNHIVYGRAEAVNDGFGQYALDNSPLIIQALEEFTHIPYALSKIGQVAVPVGYFDLGAMENWGLVLYRENLLFYKEGVSSIEQKQKSLTIVAHEYGHQWYGNLVSPLWWKYIWLNEGFATYCEYYASNEVDSSFRMMEQYVTSVNQKIMIVDSTETTRPMTSDAQTPKEINALFDHIVYEKAGAVIRMCEHFLSRPVFFNGLIKYLNKMSYSSATALDLFDSLQESVDEMGAEWLGNLTVHEIFDTWHLQSGFPYIYAIRDYDQNTLHLIQNRFHSTINSEPTDELWYVPINYATASNPNFENTAPTFWLLQKWDTIELNENSWIILNKKSTGYYRVNYDETNWIHIINQLNEDHTVIDPLNRAQLIDDSFSLAEAGLVDYTLPLILTEYIDNETDFIPLTSYYNHVNKLNKLLVTSEISENFKNYISEKLEFVYDFHSFDKNITEHTMILNRGKIHSLMCRFGYKKCTSEMEQRLIESLTTGDKIHPDLQSSVYCGGMVNDNKLEMKWDKMYERYIEVEIEEKTHIVEGLACSSNKEILKRILLTAAGMYQNHKFFGDDTTNAIDAVCSKSYLGAVTTLEFLMNNYQSLNLTHKQKSNMFRNISEALFAKEHKEMLNELSKKWEANVPKFMTAATSKVDNNYQILQLVVPQLTTYFAR